MLLYIIIRYMSCARTPLAQTADEVFSEWTRPAPFDTSNVYYCFAARGLDVAFQSTADETPIHKKHTSLDHSDCKGENPTSRDFIESTWVQHSSLNTHSLAMWYLCPSKPQAHSPVRERIFPPPIESLCTQFSGRYARDERNRTTSTASEIISFRSKCPSK